MRVTVLNPKRSSIDDARDAVGAGANDDEPAFVAGGCSDCEEAWAGGGNGVRVDDREWESVLACEFACDTAITGARSVEAVGRAGSGLGSKLATTSGGGHCLSRGKSSFSRGWIE